MSGCRQLLGALLLVAVCRPAPAGRLDNVPLLSDAYPRAFFFRQSEGRAANPAIAYERWERSFLPLDGIIGKCLDEEIPGRSRRNVEFFTRFKQRHPEKTVLLHFNGNSRDARFETSAYFPGHWIYYNGCRLARDLEAEPGEAVVHVEDPSLFRVDIGRYGDKNEDVGICLLDAAGRPDWSQAEHVQLLGVDRAAKTLRVGRGAFGTAPRAFPAKRAYIAAHATEGPWGRQSNLLWYCNYATVCPRDGQGRTCADLLIADLVRWFGDDGPLALFDGIEFDVLHFGPLGAGARGVDVDADGKPDGGVIDGVNVYGLGVHRFVERLRAALGDDRLLLADGHSPRNQRSVTVLNGIESEGWPSLGDRLLADWSGGLNRHLFWRANARAPVLNYINHKFMKDGKPAPPPANVTRLVLAAAQFTDTAFTYSLAPPAGGNALVGVWDELCMGVEQRARWLGRPEGETRRLGFDAPDVLDGAGAAIGPEFAARWRTEDARIAAGTEARLCLTGLEEGQDRMAALLPEIHVPAGDLLVRCTVAAAPRAGYGPLLPRLVWLGCRGAGQLITAPLPSAAVGLRGEAEVPLEPGRGGAALDYREQLDIDGESHEAYFTHPPYGRGQGPGYVVWTRQVRLPKPNCLLEFHTGITRAPSRSDGVVFRIELDDGDARTAVFDYHHTDFAWRSHRVDLADWQGREVALRFVSDCGPKDNTTADHAYWGDVQVRGDAPAFRRTPRTAGRIMTWANEQPFEASFYFRDVGPATVDLTLEAEGSEPLWLSGLRLHAGVDAMVREFEGGAVLANPSMKAYTFDLAALFPGASFRRIQGRREQDPTANNGEPVGAAVTLAACDALFLVRQ